MRPVHMLTTLFLCFLMTMPAIASDESAEKKNIMAPDFLPSVIWEKGTPDISLVGMRGKMVITVFFQSWCPKCNEWSPGVFREFEAAFADDPSVVLLAIKTDGGTPQAATSYLKSKGADLSKWHIGSDQGARYYINSTGADKLFWYTIIDHNGYMKSIGYAGRVAPNPGYAKRFGKLAKERSALIKGEDYDAKFAPIKRMIEVGDYMLALKSLKGAPKSLREQSDKMKQEMMDGLKAEAEKLSENLASSEVLSRDKYMAWKRLNKIAELRRTEPGTVASDAIKKHKKDAWLKDEMKAHKTYDKILSMTGKYKGKQFAAELEELFPQLAEKYGDTAYGLMAKAQAKLMPRMREQ